MDEYTIEVIKTALKHMFNDGYLSICTIDKCVKLAGVVPNKAEHDALSALHCVNFSEMSPGLRQQVFERTLALFDAPGLDLGTIDLVFNETTKVFERAEPRKITSIFTRKR